MILHVIDSDFVYRGRLQNFKSLRWEERYNEKGKLTLVLDDTETNAAMIKKGCYFYRADRKTAMVAVDITRNGERSAITIGGYTSMHILDRRIIKGKLNVSNLESGMYAAVNENLRGLPFVSLAQSKGLTESAELEFENAEMIKSLTEMCKAGDLGMRMRLDNANKTHVFEVFKGTDKAYVDGSGGVVFSSEFGNLANLTVEEDDELFKNVAIIKGVRNDEDETEFYREVGSAEGFERREIFVKANQQKNDQTDAEYLAYLDSEGLKALQKHYEVLTFKAQISSGAWQRDYDLGDKVTCKSTRYGLRFDTRITAFVETIEAGTQSVSLTLGEPTITFLQGAILKNG